MISLLRELPPPPTGKTGWPWTEESKHLPPVMPDDKPWPKISIVTPSYNQGQFLEETIRSVLLQNYPNLEYIIIDGGSPDNSVEIIKKYEQWLTYWNSEKDKGQSDAINKGLMHCTGDIFNWINADDYYEPDTLNIIGYNFVKNMSINVICGQERQLFNDNSNSLKIVKHGTVVNKSFEVTLFLRQIDQPVTFFRKSVIDCIGMLNTNLHYFMDAELWLRYLMRYGQDNFLKIDHVLANFRHHASSKTDSKKNMFNREHSLLLYSFGKFIGIPDYLLNHLKEDIIEPSDIFTGWQFTVPYSREKITAIYQRHYALILIKQNKYKEARIEIMKYIISGMPGFDKATFIELIKLFIIPKILLSPIKKLCNKYRYLLNKTYR
jgi:glycosyltransferase involved in cell wall biosynthesis